MELERQRRVEELFHSALRVPVDQRAGFLLGACQDLSLREEVESLLAYESSANEFIEKPAFEVAAKLMAEDHSHGDGVPPELAGGTLQRYHVLEKLGGGGMGVVYKAEDTRLHRTVALKFLPPELASEPLSLDRFQREAFAASALNHPNICTVYDIGEHESQPFIAMELLEGQTLEQRIGGRPLLTQELLKLGVQIADALHAAHARGILHRDIKPSNIFITAHGEAKILDFGLAKLQESETPDLQPAITSEAAAGPVSNLTLTRTGAAMGTAGYMSPEQVRGEKLDARTDLFSFGLVLYEMATGQRAFTGNTGPVLQEAILKQTPSPARELNPKLPAKFDKIISKALEKNREARYQTAWELRADLERLRDETAPGHAARRWVAVAGAALLVLATGASFWFAKRQQKSTPPPEIKLRQLTSNSSETRVMSGAISPDGKYLAYTDWKGMHLKIMDTGETRTIPQPEALKDQKVEWESAAWFQDSSRLLANAHPPGIGFDWNSPGSSIWIIPVLGGAPRKIRDDATGWSVSPDGSLVSFKTNRGRLGDREIWVMGPDGEGAQKFYETGENEAVSGLYWSPDGRRIIYSRVDDAGDHWMTRNLKGGPATPVFPPYSETKKVNDLVWLPDGRVIYSAEEPASLARTRNFWEMRVDQRTGEMFEKPRRLTNWAGILMSYPIATKDGKRLAFLEGYGHATVYVADLEAGGTRVGKPRHLTLTQSNDQANWTADSKALIVMSNRNGEELYKQSLNEDTAELLVTEQSGIAQSVVTPDGKWILYQLDYQLAPKPGEPPRPPHLVRIPATGGASQKIFAVKYQSLASCARSPSALCVIAERTEDRKELVVTAFDPMKGRGPELTRIALDPIEDHWELTLSPDGARLALFKSPTDTIRILSLQGETMSEIRLKDWSNLGNLSWTPDGRGLLISSAGVRGGAVVLRVDLKGGTQVLWENPGGNYCYGLISPDGRHVALVGSTDEGNVWMMENF